MTAVSTFAGGKMLWHFPGDWGNGCMGSRRQRPEVRKAQILRAAKESFRIHGLQTTTVDQIAAQAEVSVGLLYRYFKSKSDMVQAIITEDVELQMAQIERAIEEGPTDLADLPRVMINQLVEESQNREQLALMLEVTVEVYRNAPLREFVRRKRVEVRESLAKKLESNGLDHEAARGLIEQIERASAVATGVALEALIYSDSVSTSSRSVASIVKAALFSFERH
jgi:AcrR family transcriptional regulator